MLIPSIDLMNGQAVQLKQGKDHVLTAERSPEDLLVDFNKYGDVAIIDLDAALGKGDNLPLIERLCGLGTVRVGGGIRSKDRAVSLLKAGAERLIIGTSATPEFLQQLPRHKVMVALDHKAGEVVDKGWTVGTGEQLLARAERLAPYCSGFLITFVETEGMMTGMDLDAVKDLQAKIDLPITVAGGVATTAEAAELCRLGVDVQVGMALYTGKLDLADAFVGSLDFEKFGDKGLIPTITQDANGQVLMLAYSSQASLEKALREGKGIYYSRSRNDLWEKGLSSGHTQRLISARTDCDRDAILFTVLQTGGACHTNSYSCFGSHQPRPAFDLTQLYSTLAERKARMPEGSYTTTLLQDKALLASKLREEAEEVISAPNRDNMRWEVADLLYFASVFAATYDLNWDDIVAELGARHG